MGAAQPASTFNAVTPAVPRGRVFHAVEQSAFQYNAPTSEQIEAVFDPIGQAVAVASGMFTGLPSQVRGQWLGPQSRITRRLNTGSPTAGFETHAANVWVVPSSMSAADAAAEFDAVGRVLLTSLKGQSADWTMESFPYNPKYNGAPLWWTSGNAARTHYRDEWPQLAARFAPTENPIGPDSPDVRAQTAGDIVRSAGGVLTPLLWIGGGLALVWVVLAMRSRKDRAERTTERNPWLVAGAAAATQVPEGEDLGEDTAPEDLGEGTEGEDLEDDDADAA